MRSRHLMVGLAMASIAVIEFAVVRGIDLKTVKVSGGSLGTSTVAAAPGEPATEVKAPAYDTTHLLRPEKKFIGVSLDGKPTEEKRVEQWADRIGKHPNMLTIFESFDDDFAAKEARAAYQQGTLPVIRWEPFDAKLKDIAAGKHDAYVTKFATSVRTVNVPTVITFAHEMNGGWYSWGANKNRAADYVAAWRHLHDIFASVDATNVIWAWTPNVINPVPSVKLKPLYPGDAYVDWIGIDGYFTEHGKNTYEGLFGPTKAAIRKFTKKPFLIVETGAEPGTDRPTWIRELVAGVRNDKEMLGFVYFNQNGSARWKIDADSAALSALRKEAARAEYGFIVQ